MAETGFVRSAMSALAIRRSTAGVPVVTTSSAAVSSFSVPIDLLAVAQRDGNGAEARSDLRVGIDQRLEYQIARQPRRDAGQVRADVGAGVAHGVAARAGGGRVLDEELAAAADVAADERRVLECHHQRIGAARFLVGVEALLQLRRAARLHRVHQVELHRRRELAGRQLVEEAVERALGVGALQSAEHLEAGLLIRDGPLPDHGRQARDLPGVGNRQRRQRRQRGAAHGGVAVGDGDLHRFVDARDLERLQRAQRRDADRRRGIALELREEERRRRLDLEPPGGLGQRDLVGWGRRRIEAHHEREHRRLRRRRIAALRLTDVITVDAVHRRR